MHMNMGAAEPRPAADTSRWFSVGEMGARCGGCPCGSRRHASSLARRQPIFQGRSMFVAGVSVSALNPGFRVEFSGTTSYRPSSAVTS